LNHYCLPHHNLQVPFPSSWKGVRAFSIVKNELLSADFRIFFHLSHISFRNLELLRELFGETWRQKVRKEREGLVLPLRTQVRAQTSEDSSMIWI